MLICDQYNTGWVLWYCIASFQHLHIRSVHYMLLMFIVLPSLLYSLLPSLLSPFSSIIPWSPPPPSSTPPLSLSFLLFILYPLFSFLSSLYLLPSVLPCLSPSSLLSFSTSFFSSVSCTSSLFPSPLCPHH